MERAATRVGTGASVAAELLARACSALHAPLLRLLPLPLLLLRPTLIVVTVPPIAHAQSR
jgi:hypothetical protein